MLMNASFFLVAYCCCIWVRLLNMVYENFLRRDVLRWEVILRPQHWFCRRLFSYDLQVPSAPHGRMMPLFWRVVSWSEVMIEEDHKWGVFTSFLFISPQRHSRTFTLFLNHPQKRHILWMPSHLDIIDTPPSRTVESWEMAGVRHLDLAERYFDPELPSTPHETWCWPIWLRLYIYEELVGESKVVRWKKFQLPSPRRCGHSLN